MIYMYMYLYNMHAYMHMYMYLLVYCLINDAYTMYTCIHTYTHSRMLQAVVASLPCSPPLLQPCHLPAADTDPQVTEIYMYHIVRT